MTVKKNQPQAVSTSTLPPKLTFFSDFHEDMITSEKYFSPVCFLYSETISHFLCFV